jgi:predicted enzyme related to lactoylglutathione lyase
MAKITGIGGIFVKSPDPKALCAWYRDVLGMAVQDWGAALLEQNPQSPDTATWTPFKQDTQYFAPSTREVMINFAVDDLDAYLKQIEAKGVKVLDRQTMEGMGSFAWIMDPDGTKIEFWQPS